MRILLIEDDVTTQKALAELLQAHNFVVDVAEDGVSGWNMAKRQSYDLILLDIILPKLNGITLCRQLRQQQQTVPIIFLTSRNTLSDKLEGLNAGADDYVVKSSDPQELLARIQVLLRRGHTEPEFTLHWGELSLDPKTCAVTYAQQDLVLSRKEFQILELFMRRPNWVFSRQAIIDHVWGLGEDPPTESTVKSHIKAIRRKLKDLNAVNIIETVYGQGYRLDPAAQSAPSSELSFKTPVEPQSRTQLETQSDEPEAETAIADGAPLPTSPAARSTDQQDNPDSPVEAPGADQPPQSLANQPQLSSADSANGQSSPQDKPQAASQPKAQSTQSTSRSSTASMLSADKQKQLQANLNRLWQQAKQTAWQRLNTIEQLLYFLQPGLPDRGLLDQIGYIAHKLGGALGIFGQVEASRYAYQLENLIQSASHPASAARADQLDTNAATSATAAPQTPEHHSSTFKPENPQAAGRPPCNAELIATVRQLVQSIRDCLDAEATPLTTPTPSQSPQPTYRPQIPRLLMIDDDPELARPIVAVAADWSIHAAIADDLADIETAIEEYQPDVIVLDVYCQQGSRSGLQILSQLSAKAESVPVIVYSYPLSAVERLQAIQLGAVAFVCRPAVPEKVLTCVRQHLVNPKSALHVLAVDDDEQQLALLQTCFEREGLRFTGLSQPEALLQTIQRNQPDLILLDIVMPQMGGLELCQLLRSDAEYQKLPVMMLTQYDDCHTRQQALRVGADVVLSKHDPVLDNLGHIQAWFTCDRTVLHWQTVDPLTGLPNRCGATQTLQQQIAIADRFNQPLCLGVINLDNLQRFNAEQGRMAGDQLLRQFTTFLQQHCLPTDMVVRWRAEEFIVSMLGLERTAAVERLAQLLELWRAQQLIEASSQTPSEPASQSDEWPSVSFSAGVAAYPVDGQSLEFLYRVAEAALYQAKLTGRDRILPASWHMLDPQHPHFEVVVIGTDTHWLRSLMRALETRGYPIHWLQSGHNALDYLDRMTQSSPSERRSPPALSPPLTTILLTTELPDMSVMELLPQLKKITEQGRSPAPTIVALTQPTDDIEYLRSQGITDYISLPCDATAVIAHIRRQFTPAATRYS